MSFATGIRLKAVTHVRSVGVRGLPGCVPGFPRRIWILAYNALVVIRLNIIGRDTCANEHVVEHSVT